MRTLLSGTLAVFALCLITIIFSTANANIEEPDDGAESVDGDEEGDPGLGGGADALWLADGIGSLDENGESHLTDISIQGRRSGDLHVEVIAWARFGPYRETIFEGEFTIAALESLDIPLYLAPALTIHEKQSAYVTKIRARINEIRDGGEIGYTKLLPLRYLAWHPDTQSTEVFDDDSLKAMYPGGVFGAAEREAYEILVREAGSDGIVVQIEPGIPYPGDWTTPPDAGDGEEEKS